MSVSILVVNDEPDVAELFRQRFRHEVRHPADPAAMAYHAERVSDAATERPAPVGRSSELTKAVSGKIYRFAANELNNKSITLTSTSLSRSTRLRSAAGDLSRFPVGSADRSASTATIGLGDGCLSGPVPLGPLGVPTGLASFWTFRRSVMMIARG